jgi:hypothetical protein
MMSWVRALMAALLSDTAALKGNNINLNAQNTLLNQSGDITANNNLNLMAKTLTNIANQQTTTQKHQCCVLFAIYLNFFILIPNDVLGESFDGCFAKRYTKGDFNALVG